VASAVIAASSIIENGFIFETLSVMLIAFLYALAVAVIIGLPFQLFFKKAKAAHFAIAGSLAGTAILVPALISTRGADPSVLKLTLTLLIAGSIAGWTFHSVLKRP
jgi:hypothetical protein